MSLVLWAGLGVVAAHPFSSERLGHRTEVHLSADRVVVDYRVEVPVRQVLRELEAAGETPQVYAESRLGELAEGWWLKRDGERVALERQPDPEDASGTTSRFASFHVVLSAPLPAVDGPQRLKLVNENFPGPQAFHYVEVQVAPDVSVLASSLFDLKDGEVRNLREARWRMEDESRVTELLIVQDPPGVLDRALAPLLGGAEGPRYAHQAVERPPLAAWLAGEVRSGLAALALGLALGLGVLAGPGRGRRDVVQQGLGLVTVGVALGLLGVRFAAPAVLAWSGVAAGAWVLAVAVLQLLRPGPPRVGVGSAVLVAALGLQLPALGLALVGLYAVGVGIGTRTPPVRRGVVAVLLAVVGIALVVRGLGVVGLVG